MVRSKFETFILTMIEKTKAGLLLWERVDTRVFQQALWPDYDLSRSFISFYADGRLLLVYEKSSGAPRCFMSPSKTLPFRKVVGIDADDGAALLLRLYNLVYNSFFFVKSFADATILPVDNTDELPNLENFSIQ